LHSITRKPELRRILSGIDPSASDAAIITMLEEEILNSKIRFPLLEFFTEELYKILYRENIYSFSDALILKDYIGTYVICGTLLRCELNTSLEKAFSGAAEYIETGDKWYVCDIIGERVFGEGLLKHYDSAFGIISNFRDHHNIWVRRSAGVAIHYAVKKGLQKEKVRPLFELAASFRSSKEFHIKKGFGWALKTIAKFHPDLLTDSDKLLSDPETGTWFKNKIKMGMQRNKHAGIRN
jgi:3-methyladenine DNA glycosylase AlkD